MNLGWSVFDVLAWKDVRKRFFSPFFTTKLRPSVETPDFCAVEWSTNLNTFSARYFLCFSCLFHLLICLKQNCRFSSILYFLASSVSIKMLINIHCSFTLHVSFTKPVSTLVKIIFLHFSSNKKNSLYFCWTWVFFSFLETYFPIFLSQCCSFQF